MSPEQELWSRVTELAIADAKSTGITGPQRDTRSQARSFLTGDSGALPVVLAALDMDRDFWLDRVLPTLKREWYAVDATIPRPHDTRNVGKRRPEMREFAR